MPQTRKRKTKEKISDDVVEKKEKIDSTVLLKKSARRKSKRGVADLPETTLDKSSTNCYSKKKIIKKNFDKDLKSSNVITKKKRTKGHISLSPTKDPKLGKAKVHLHSLKIEQESKDSENFHFALSSSDSGILSESVDTSSKEESKCSISVKPEISGSSYENVSVKQEDSSSESEWEEVEDSANLDDYKPDIPKEGVEITIDCPDLHVRKRKKKQFDENEWIRLHINRRRKDVQLSIHKSHLLCLLAHGMYVNNILNSGTLKAFALSLIPQDILSYTSGKKIDKIDACGIEKIISWFRDAFTFEVENCLFLNIFSSLEKGFEYKKSQNASEYNLMLIVIARTLGFKVRFCISLYPVTYKATNLIKKPNSNSTSKKLKTDKEKESCSEQKSTNVKKRGKDSKPTKSVKITKSSESKKEVKIASRPSRSARKSYRISDEDDNVVDDDFIMQDNISSDEDDFKPQRVRSKAERPCKQKSNRKVLSSDSEPPSPHSSILEPGTIVCWAEIFSKPDKQWISVECVNNIVNKPYDIEALVPKPVSYILAFDNDSCVKDVTRRYCNEYLTATMKLRVDPEWWEDTLEPFLPPNSKQNKDEEKKLDDMLINKPLPHTIQGFKNHPLYALKRHLLKFEAVYPPDAPPVGFMRGEPIYARDCVCQLHSRETWLKEARVVRIGEQPYKIVKARPKWDKIAGLIRTDLPLEIFGLWQTEQYEPPIAVDGKVPRNEYGNVELFKSCMLPRGTVHLQLPGLNRVAKKLGIDCSPAVVGFDGHKGSIHPVFDGFVICEEFQDTIVAAWEEEQENARKREEEKREKRIYGNWKKLIKGLLIRERLKRKYDAK